MIELQGLAGRSDFGRPRATDRGGKTNEVEPPISGGGGIGGLTIVTEDAIVGGGGGITATGVGDVAVGTAGDGILTKTAMATAHSRQTAAKS
jgi:hypothetical protein